MWASYLWETSKHFLRNNLSLSFSKVHIMVLFKGHFVVGFWLSIAHLFHNHEREIK